MGSGSEPFKGVGCEGNSIKLSGGVMEEKLLFSEEEKGEKEDVKTIDDYMME